MTTSSRRRILIAEDNENARLILTDLCRMFGYEVEAVAHGLAAVEAFAAGSYDVILMDCHMPVLDGFDATRRIRAADGGKRPVIIAVTGDGNRDDCIAAGMDDYLTKPVRPQLLRAALTRWLEPSGRIASPSAPPTART
jgi:two-component system, sensor histidine kinase and response regulator